MTEPGSKYDSLMWMRDGQFQALLPYSSDSAAQEPGVKDDDPAFANVQSMIHPVSDKSLNEMAGDLAKVFSYHLAWCGDVSPAQALTEKTVDLCLRRLDRLKAGRLSLQVWLLRMAQRARRTTRAGIATSQESLEEDGSMVIADLARLAWLSEELAQSPKHEAEALTLTFFAGLSQADAGEVMGVNEKKVKLLVGVGLTACLRRWGLPDGDTMPRKSRQVSWQRRCRL